MSVAILASFVDTVFGVDINDLELPKNPFTDFENAHWNRFKNWYVRGYFLNLMR